jgi:hypothetical protein
VFLKKKSTGWWTKSINTILSSAIHHRQNRLELIRGYMCDNKISCGLHFT